MQRSALLAFAGVFLIYLFVLFHVLAPRSLHAPRLMYNALVINVFVGGVTTFILSDYIAVTEIFFVPFILLSVLVAEWHGVVALALFAAFLLMPTQWRLVLLPSPSLYLGSLNQFMIVGAFVLTGLLCVFLSRSVTRRRAESAQAAARAAQRWELVSGLGLRVQQESRPEAVYALVAEAIKPLGQDFVVALWDDPERTMRIEYFSLDPALVSLFEKLTGQQVGDLRLRVADLPMFRQAMAERRGLFYETNADMVRQMLPGVPSDVLGRIVRQFANGMHVVIPLFVADRVLGFIAVWGSDLDPGDLPALTGAAQQIALVLERGDMLSRESKRVAQLTLVSEIASRAVGLLDQDELIRALPDMLVQRFHFENVSIFGNDAAARQAVLRSRAGSSIDFCAVGYHQSWDVGLVGLVSRTGATVLANDVRTDPRYFTVRPEHDICRSELCVPFKRGDDVFGALDVQSTRVRFFDETDVSTLETLANQIATILERGELFSAERKRAAQLALVSAIAERMAAILDPQRLLSEVVVLVREQFGYHSVALFTMETDQQQVLLRAVSGGYVDVFPPHYRQPLSVGLIGAAGRTGTTVVVNDVSRDPRFYFPKGATPLTGSEMTVPLKLGSQTLGVLDIQAQNLNAFDASDIVAMETLTSQIAIALENARLYAQSKNEAEVKATLLRELSHRVKNNLTTVVGLLSLGLEDVALPREEIITETLTRVQSMVVAHTLLASSPRARVDLLELSQHVLGDSIRRLTLPGQVVPFRVEGVSVEISAHQAASLALVLNELVTNAIKHGGVASQQISLCVALAGERARLEFVNHVVQPPLLVHSQDDGGWGLKLIRTLVEKDLHGAITMNARDHDVSSVILFTPEQ